MGVLRSDEISHLKLRMPGDIESAVQLMDLLGKAAIDALEFIDLTRDDLEAKKTFEPMLNRCEIMESKILNCVNLAKEFNRSVHPYRSYQSFLNDLTDDQAVRQLNYGSYFDAIESEVLDNERRMIDLIDSYNKMKEDFIIELEKQMVFKKLHSVLGPAQSQLSHYGSLKSITGIIKLTDDLKMNRMIVRSTHGRAMATFFDFAFPTELKFNFTKSTKIEKKIFIVFYPADDQDLIYKKVMRACEILNASTYTLPEGADRVEHMRRLASSILEKKNFLFQAEGSIANFFREMVGSTDKPGRVDLYRLYFKKERMIYSNLTKCILRENFIDGEVWILSDQRELLQSILLNERLGDEDDSDSKPKGTFIELEENLFDKPTHIPSNDFLYPFQEIVNTYGVPHYQEINPAFFTIVTFPFLFGIMFGDIGHGIVILAFGIYLCVIGSNKQKRNSYLLMMFIKVRYFLLLLGISSVYCGILYNDFLSVPLPVFGSCYDNEVSSAKKRADCVYPIGLDPKWYTATNELSFVNSFKMKFSVIFGVMHMTFGIGLKGINHLHFDQWLSFVFEFIPQLVFMMALFGYMVVMIFIKWLTDWSKVATEPPSIITIMINIFIKQGSVDGMPLWHHKLKDGHFFQEEYNFALLIVVALMIPLMIIPKPLIEYLLQKKQRESRIAIEGSNRINRNNNDEPNRYIHISNLKVKEAFIEKSFIDLLINQSIEMIEFLLGTVSNTASYLRLWALSLAHVELTKVFIEKTLLYQIKEGDFQFGLSFLEVFVGYFILANVTLVVLIGMDFMECFLHTLRLHWVEFQTKFYKADGYLFVPYSFKSLISGDEQ